MTDEPPSPATDADPGGRRSRNTYAVLLIGLTVALGIAAIFCLRPHVAHWLEVRSAYGNLSSADYDARIDAIRRLRMLGEETESELISLLHHRDASVRRFAAAELAHRTRLTDDVLEAFLSALESNQHAAEIGGSAPKLFLRHAEESTGPLTETDRRMIGWLKSELDSTIAEQSGTAAWTLTAFVTRDPSLKEPLAAYLKIGANSPTSNHKFLVLREMASRDPSMRDQYLEVLLSGLGSSDVVAQGNALWGLANLKNAPDNLRSRLEARREESTDPGEISRINEALESLPDRTAETQ